MPNLECATRRQVRRRAEMAGCSARSRAPQENAPRSFVASEWCGQIVMILCSAPARWFITTTCTSASLCYHLPRIYIIPSRYLYKF